MRHPRMLIALLAIVVVSAGYGHLHTPADANGWVAGSTMASSLSQHQAAAFTPIR